MATTWTRDNSVASTPWNNAYDNVAQNWIEAGPATWLDASSDSNWLTGVITTRTVDPWTREV